MTMRARYSRIQMSDLSFKRPMGPVDQKALEADVARIEAERPKNWPQQRQLAILMIQRSSIALDCMAHLSGKGIHPRQHDFAYLRNHNFAVKDRDGRFHSLTAAGIRAARECTEALGKTLGLHHLTIIPDSWHEHRARCCCGWSTSVNRRSNANFRERLERQYDRHLADPDAWKRSNERVQAIINNVGKPIASDQSNVIDIDDCVNVYGDGQAWPQINTPCTSDKAPTGQCEFGNDPAICIHCGRRT